MTTVATPERFVVRSWADGGAVFDRRTGSTHCLNATTLSVFLALQTAPESDDDSLAGSLQPSMPTSTSDQRRDAVNEARRALAGAGLLDHT